MERPSAEMRKTLREARLGDRTRSHVQLCVPGVGSLPAEAAPCVGTALSETVLAALSRFLSPCLGTAKGDADGRHGAPSALRPQNSAPEPGALRSRDAAPEAGALMCCFLCVPGPTVQSGRFQASGSVSLSRFTACPPLCVCPASLSVPTSESAPRTPSVLSRRHLLPPRP
ncbi:unnamed protein product [Rangifer tarandus platyrhynchus]|uniref:Uncharacterized protein n=2 Tax=Rangifer tarandus platyrhynchus TaxID=3082113 RepID=A0ABN8ZWK9_RANTA|nr:unnamed protein product [Rangifer tarandus platyrhynchus]CAI9710110.1 unnamed protein product [Rangifer tarandus platyrhynchus]